MLGLCLSVLSTTPLLTRSSSSLRQHSLSTKIPWIHLPHQEHPRPSTVFSTHPVCENTVTGPQHQPTALSNNLHSHPQLPHSKALVYGTASNSNNTNDINSRKRKNPNFTTHSTAQNTTITWNSPARLKSMPLHLLQCSRRPPTSAAGTRNPNHDLPAQYICSRPTT